MAVTWSYDGVPGNGTLTATIDDAIVGHRYQLLCDDQNSSSPPVVATATTQAISAFGIDSTPNHNFVAELFHGTTTAVDSSYPCIYANVFQEDTASATGWPYSATWAYDGANTTQVTITAAAGVQYYLWGRAAGTFEFNGPYGPFTAGSTQVLSWAHSTPTAGKRFDIVLTDWNTGDDYSVRLFDQGAASPGSPGNPQPSGTPPAISSVAPTSGCYGDPIIITGTGFTGTTDVTFNGVSAAFTVDSDTQITATVPLTTTGTLFVTTPFGSDSGGTFTIDPGPANDAYPVDFTEFFDRTEYYLGQNSGGCTVGTTLCATPQAGEPDPAPGFPATHSVWLTLEPPTTGTIRFWVTSTDPAMADGILSVYDWVGGPPSGLGAPIAQGDNELGTQPQCDAVVVGGNDYVVQVDTRNTGGTFTLHWKYLPVGAAPANNDFADAQNLGGDCGKLLVTLTDANAECGEPKGYDDPDGPYNTVWYKWTPGWTGQAFVTIQGVSAGFHDLDLDVFIGASLAGLVLVDSHEFFGTPPATASRTFAVHAGTTYYLRWQGRGEPLTFTMTWETDANPWKARVGFLSAGDARFNTGLGETPTAVIIYASGIAPGVYTPGMRVGVGAATPAGQWGSSYAYPWRIHDGTNGAQYGQQRFSSTAVISVVNTDGSVYAEAAITAFNPDGTIDLNWLTDPGDGLWLAFAAFSGISAEVGVINMDGSAGVTTLTPADPTTRLMVAAVAASNPGETVSFTAPATTWSMQGWAETMTHTADTSIAAGIETGIGWFGPRDDEGDFLLGSSVGAFFNVTADLLSQYVGCASFDVTRVAGWTGKFGWFALGGCGWHGHQDAFSGSTTFPSDFWTQAGLALGGSGYNISSPTTNNTNSGTSQLNVGAFDETDAQFGFSELFYPATGGFSNFQTPTVRSGYQDRIFSDDDSYTSEGGHTTIDLPGRPTLGGTVTRTGSGAFATGGGVVLLLGNYAVATLRKRLQQIIRYR